jgi:hypothetical protein
MALLGVEELTDAPKVRVCFPPHDVFVAMRRAREASLGRFIGKIEVLGEALDIPLVQGDHGVGAAVAGALQAIVERHRRSLDPKRQPELA